MQKMMFNDRYGLTDAVLNGRKTQTRRTEFNDVEQNKLIAHVAHKFYPVVEDNRVVVRYRDGYCMFCKPTRYKVGEVVAVAQSYNDTWRHTGYMTAREAEQCPGYHNKMFVKAERMPHHIRITGIRVQRLQDISDADCIKEGIYSIGPREIGDDIFFVYGFPGSKMVYSSPRIAYSVLIDRVSGKGTWNRNPFVVAYEFELVD